MQDQVTILKKDFRELEGQFDKLVSIEMIEAIGHRLYKTFFQKCGQLLKPEGLLAIQAITITDNLFNESKDFIDELSLDYLNNKKIYTPIFFQKRSFKVKSKKYTNILFGI